MITKMINFELLANTAQYYKVKFFKINLYLRLSLSLSVMGRHQADDKKLTGKEGSVNR